MGKGGKAPGPFVLLLLRGCACLSVCPRPVRPQLHGVWGGILFFFSIRALQSTARVALRHLGPQPADPAEGAPAAAAEGGAEADGAGHSRDLAGAAEAAREGVADGQRAAVSGRAGGPAGEGQDAGPGGPRAAVQEAAAVGEASERSAEGARGGAPDSNGRVLRAEEGALMCGDSHAPSQPSQPPTPRPGGAAG